MDRPTAAVLTGSVAGQFLVVGSLDDQVIDDAMGFVDVLEGAIAQAADGRIIFFPGDVVMSFIQQLERTVIAAGAVHAGIDRGMIVQVLSVPNRSLLDFIDGSINFFDGVLLFFVHVMGGRQVFQMSAGMSQVGKGMQVRGMTSRFVGKTQSGAESNKKHKQGAMACDFHGFLGAFRQNEVR
jgi:hypothetical protein